VSGGRALGLFLREPGEPKHNDQVKGALQSTKRLSFLSYASWRRQRKRARYAWGEAKEGRKMSARVRDTRAFPPRLLVCRASLCLRRPLRSLHSSIPRSLFLSPSSAHHLPPLYETERDAVVNGGEREGGESCMDEEPKGEKNSKTKGESA
jgi:hypothetical protein